MKKRNIPLILTIIYCCIIFGVSSIPGKELQGVTTPDYILHFLEYSGLGFLLCWWRLSAGENTTRAVIQAVAMAALYGITDEFHQYFVPGRFCSLSDWIADSAGATAGAFIMALAHRFISRTCPKSEKEIGW